MEIVTESLGWWDEVQKPLLKQRLGAAYRPHYNAEATMGAPITASEYRYYFNARTCRGPYCEVRMKQGGNTKLLLSSLNKIREGGFFNTF